MSEDNEIRDCILDFARRRGTEKSLCPSEVARKLQPDDWRSLMPEVRRVAATLVKDNLVTVTQFGKPVDPLNPKGHIRISLSRDPQNADHGRKTGEES